MNALLDFVRRHPRLFVLTGAGISTDSGIPGYRDARGQWQRSQPITLQAFLGSHAGRQRYWARMAAWARWSRRMSTACTSAPAAAT